MRQSTPVAGLIPGLIQGAARILLALLILLLPKCGLCLAVYLNLFSVLGISITKYFPYLLPLLSVLLGLNLLIGFLKAKRMNDYRSWGLSLFATAVLLVNKLWFTIDWLSWSALVLLTMASVLQLWQSRKICSRSLL